jgi:hypothetical protein
MDMSMETRNYYSDRRVSEALRSHAYTCDMKTMNRIRVNEDFVESLSEDHPKLAEKFTSACWDEDEDTYIIHIPVQAHVCYTCRGKGTAVNPSIDCGGISSDEFDEDPLFAEEYFSGLYDIKCPECRGLRVTGTPDFESITANNPLYEVIKKLIEYAQDLDDYHTETMRNRMFNY